MASPASNSNTQTPRSEEIRSQAISNYPQERRVFEGRAQRGPSEEDEGNASLEFLFHSPPTPGNVTLTPGVVEVSRVLCSI